MAERPYQVPISCTRQAEACLSRIDWWNKLEEISLRNTLHKNKQPLLLTSPSMSPKNIFLPSLPSFSLTRLLTVPWCDLFCPCVPWDVAFNRCFCVQFWQAFFGRVFPSARTLRSVGLLRAHNYMWARDKNVCRRRQVGDEGKVWVMRGW